MQRLSLACALCALTTLSVAADPLEPAAENDGWTKEVVPQPAPLDGARATRR